MAIPTHILSPLVDALAELYPEAGDARAMIRFAGLDERQIDFSGKAGNTWSSIVREAELQGRTPALLARAQAQYPNYTPLTAASQAYTSWAATGRPAIGQASASSAHDPTRLAPARQIEIVEVFTGFRLLDRVIGPLGAGDLIVVAARPGMGKSSLLLDIAFNVARANHRVALFSLQKPIEEIVRRWLAKETAIDYQRLRSGDVSADEQHQLDIAASILVDLAVFMDDAPSLTVTDLNKRCHSISEKSGLDFVVVDGLDFFETQHIGDVARALKATARELNVPLLVSANVSPAVEARADRRPLLRDLSQHNADQYADVVLFIYRVDRYDFHSDWKNIAEIMVAKNNNGPTGVVSLFFSDNSIGFFDLETLKTD